MVVMAASVVFEDVDGVVLWALLLSALVFFCFYASLALPGWLHLPDSYLYVSAPVVPLLTLGLYSSIVWLAEKRRAVEIRVNLLTLRDLALGALLGAAMLSAMTCDHQLFPRPVTSARASHDISTTLCGS